MTAEATQTMGFQTEAKRLLQLMIHSLYSNREIFLRELISNASDAIDKHRFAVISDPALAGLEAEYRIRVAADAEAKTITIDDNGIGMTREEVIDNLVGADPFKNRRTIVQSMTQDVYGAIFKIAHFTVEPDFVFNTHFV